jgi:hypothetical protein
MTFATATVLPPLAILVGMVVCLEIGRRLGARRRAAAGEAEEAGASAIDGAIFALFGLLIAFTFSGATGRFDQRRDQILAEANAIGTAYLRLDLLPAEAQAPLRSLFREYVRSRLATYRKLPDLEAARAEYQRSLALQGEIWSRAVPAARAVPSPAVTTLVLPALNDVFDVANARLAASRTHVPGLVLLLLFALAMAAALVVGYAGAGSPRPTWFRKVLFAFVISATVFIILDLEYPRFGLIRLDAADRLLEEVLQQMG